MTNTLALPLVSQMQHAHAFMELGSRCPGYRKDLVVLNFDTMSDFHLDINTMVNVWWTSFLFHSASPLRNSQMPRERVCNNDQLRKRL